MTDELLKDIKEGKFYNSWTWRKKRLEIIERDNFECQHCKREGRVTVGTLYVHHIKHLKQYPKLGMEDENLITLCHHHHELEHPEKNVYKKVKFFNEERW